MDDRERVRELLGREPRGDFEVVVRGNDGDPVVVRNGPLFDDGTPMPTRYWLVGPDEVRRVSQLEAAGGVRAAEAAIDAALIDDAHRRYAAERDALVPEGHTGPRPSGGVGGTRTGVKCLHAHYAWHLAGGDDPVGRWVSEQLELPAEVRITLGESATAIAMTAPLTGAAGTMWTAELPWGVINLTTTELEGSDPPSPAQLTNALGAVGDEFDDIVRSHSELIDIAAVTFSGPLASTLARLEAGRPDVGGRFVLPREAAEEIFRTVATEAANDRAYNPGLPSEHVDTVVAACCIVLTVMRRLHLEQVTIA
ncbi:MAG TPA: DUF501 domain-containing protein [Ilumatobacteraceae bacterium]|nr:DUF501 domain-containing protein [Ilumatobacteraceae bacterium]